MSALGQFSPAPEGPELGRSATERRRRPACQTRSQLHFRLFCHFERIVNFDAQISHRAFQIAVPEQELDGPKILCSSVDKRGLGTSQRVRSVGCRIQTDLTHPVTDDTSILTCGQVRRTAKPAREQEIVSPQPALPNPRAQLLPRLFGNLELHPGAASSAALRSPALRSVLRGQYRGPAASLDRMIAICSLWQG